MNADSRSNNELDRLRKIWEMSPDEPLTPDTSATDIVSSIKQAVEKTGQINIPEKIGDQLKSLSAIKEALTRVIENSDSPQECEQAVQNLYKIVNDPTTIKRLGDKVRTVLNFIVTRSQKLIQDKEALLSFLGDIPIALDAAIKQKTKVKDTLTGEMRMPPDPTPLEMKTLEALLSRLRIPYSPIDVIKIFREEDQQKAYKLAFKSEAREEDFDQEIRRGLLRAQAILRKCKEGNADPEVIETAQEAVEYWKNMNELEFFPAERQKRLNEYYRFKVMLRNFEMVNRGEVTYEEALELNQKLKSTTKKQKDDETNA